ncbi:MAG: ABC transporter ATP-binding protein [Alphaproteobacteria bacterium]|nr:ABC transporter ATP-binding protein [Rhodospirillaceae bacterium]MBT6205656.1 ABC transporter ATP-binding protein [Rhodospirillaceae bacterium]MBT6509016.1 ABC transporter ATP-binding protein [Rhodospirillaceae bacterium]MBT7648432.1 ABC transporter ATP-binding protein [Rhodospirillaceae bacterium]MDG2483055.1 ABC transporter ATP-binding protein [Alphaproteobacteria bacterium]
MIGIEDLNVVFGRHRRDDAVHAVRDVSFSVAEGESYGLVGESGSGKSTVLRAIAGLIDDWSGTITVDGKVQGKKRSKEYRRQVQMVFQDPYGSLHPRHTVDQILKEPLQIHKLPVTDQRIIGILEEVGLGPSFRFRFPHQLSGGQRQRISIARALIMEPSVLLLDEPTSALDVSIQAEILNLLQRLRKERGLTYLLVSHNLAVVSHMCSHLAVMRLGEIVETITVEQLRERTPTHPYTRQLVEGALGYNRDFVAQIVDDL